MSGYVDSKCLVAAVQLGIPDHLAAGPKTLHQLAEVSDAKEQRLMQIMGVLHNKGIFHWDNDKEMFTNNHVSSLLVTSHWTQWHNWVDLYGNEFYDIARGIPGTLRRGCTRTAAQINFETDQNMFEYFIAQGWLPKLHRTLGGSATAQSPGILKDYPWQEFGNGPVCDIGGGEGALVALLLREHKSLRGALFDTPRVIDHAKRLYHEADGKFHDISDRVPIENLIEGDFFQSIPSFEFYTMKWVLHDWKDAEARTILRKIRDAIKVTPQSRLIVLESILTSGRAGRLSRYADINMMMTAGGQERTQAEWESLAKDSGWNVSRICHLRGAWPSAIDLRPA
jgi:hypothetical protein